MQACDWTIHLWLSKWGIALNLEDFGTTGGEVRGINQNCNQRRGFQAWGVKKGSKSERVQEQMTKQEKSIMLSF